MSFLDLHTSTSFNSYQTIGNKNELKQNFAGKVLMKLDNLPKEFIIDNTKFNLRGVIDFRNSGRSDLRVSSGHYTSYAFRGNNMWEHFDNLKDKCSIVGGNKVVNVEFIIYTE